MYGFLPPISKAIYFPEDPINPFPETTRLIWGLKESSTNLKEQQNRVKVIDIRPLITKITCYNCYTASKLYQMQQSSSFFLSVQGKDTWSNREDLFCSRMNGAKTKKKMYHLLFPFIRRVTSRCLRFCWTLCLRSSSYEFGSAAICYSVRWGGLA